MLNKVSISKCSKVWVTTEGLKERAVENDNILYILYAHFLEQRLTCRRHPINIYRTKSLLSWPAVYFKAKGPGVFQDTYLPQRAPESLQFPSSCAVFWQSSQRARCLVSQVHVCCFSGDSAPGAWSVLLMRLGGFGGWWGAARWWYRSAVVRLLPQQSTHPHSQWPPHGPEKAFSHAILDLRAGLHESHTCLQRHLHSVLSLSTSLRVLMRKENLRLSQMVEGKHTTSPSPGGEASSWESHPGKG